jgi:hemolysin III
VNEAAQLAPHHAGDTARAVGTEVKPRLRGVSHFYSLWVALVAGGVLVVIAPAGSPRVGATIYAIALVAMFGASSLFHLGNWSPGTARILLQCDHTAIFLLIAGSYTPICLLALDGPVRVLVLGVVWCVAIAGIVFEWLPVRRPRGYAIAVYLTLGWIGIAALVPLWERTGWVGVTLIALGGVSYSVGAVILAAKKPDPWPRVFGYWEIFHALVIVAATVQYCAIAFVVLPLAE